MVSGVVDDLGGGDGEQFRGFAEFTIGAVANLKLSIAIKRNAGNGLARVNSMNLACWRVG